MANLRWVRAVNIGPKRFKIVLKYPSDEKNPRPPVVIPLDPGQHSFAFREDTLVKDAAWRSLVERKWVRLEPVEFTPAFIRIKNPSPKPITIEIRSPAKRPKPSPVVVGAGKRSQPIATRALIVPPPRLIAQFGVEVDLWWAIGPPQNPHCIGTHHGEDVYYCYDCGQPIVFRYDPPRPIHI